MNDHTDDHTSTVEYAIASGRKKLDDDSAQMTSRWVETFIRDEEELGVIPDKDDVGRGVLPVPTCISTDDARWGDVEIGRYLGSGVLGIHAPPPQKP